MRVLFVCTDGYPDSGACTSLLKNMFFEGGLRDKLERLDVMTVKYHYSEKDEDNADGITVFRALAWQYIFTGEIRNNIKKYPLQMAVGILNKALILLHRKLRPKEYFNKKTLRALEKKLNGINANVYDSIVAVAGDFHVIEAVRKYTEHNKGARFVIYQVDPCFSNMTEAPQTLDSRKEFEKRAYAQADIIITTPILYKEAENNHCKHYLSKMVPMEFPNVSERNYSGLIEKKNHDGVIRCLFAGSIYSGIRDPGYTLELLQHIAMENIEIVFVGVKKEQIPEKYRGSHLKCLGVRSLEETKRLIGQADFLINIGNAMQNQVPSKLFEYISSGLPIINICKHEDCPSKPYLEKYPYAINLVEKHDGLEEQAQMLTSFLLKNAGKRMDTRRILQIYERCTPRYCAKQMLNAIEK
jgi:hypothetical protein